MASSTGLKADDTATKPARKGATPKSPAKPSAAKALASAKPVKVVKAATKTVAAKALATPATPAPAKTAAAKLLPAKALTPESATAKPATVKPVTTKARATKPAPRKAPARKPSAKAGAGTGAMLGVAAAGLAAGLVANLGRKAVVQGPSVMAGDWLEALKGEHKAALALLDQMAKTGDAQPAKRSMLLMQLKHALGKHAFTEENVIYPALREWGDKADADALNHEQGYHKQYLYELETMDKTAPEFAQKVADFRADLNAHIVEEEEKVFPQIHESLGDDKNKALTAMANKEGFKLA